MLVGWPLLLCRLAASGMGLPLENLVVVFPLRLNAPAEAAAITAGAMVGTAQAESDARDELMAGRRPGHAALAEAWSATVRRPAEVS